MTLDEAVDRHREQLRAAREEYDRAVQEADKALLERLEILGPLGKFAAAALKAESAEDDGLADLAQATDNLRKVLFGKGGGA